MRLNIRCKSNNLIREQLGSLSPSARTGGLKFNFMPGGGTKRELFRKESPEKKRTNSNNNNNNKQDGSADRYAPGKSPLRIADKKKSDSNF